MTEVDTLVSDCVREAKNRDRMASVLRETEVAYAKSRADCNFVENELKKVKQSYEAVMKENEMPRFIDSTESATEVFASLL